MTNPMVPIYAALVKKGVKKLEDVPERLRESVEKAVKKQPSE